MNKLTKIKELFLNTQVNNLPKYMVLAGFLYSAVLPSHLIGLGTNSAGDSAFVQKPAIIALEGILPLAGSIDNDSCEMIFNQNSVLVVQNNLNLNLSEIIGNLSEIDFRNNLNGISDKKVIGNVLADKISDKSLEVASVRENVIVTAYSSTPDQTDSSPFITAMGSTVRDGIVACNFLKFGTKVKLPEMYGDKVFVVEDRMAKRNSHKVDVWMPSREQALKFGVKTLTLEILE